jgi:hypothetical protein
MSSPLRSGGENLDEASYNKLALYGVEALG